MKTLDLTEAASLLKIHPKTLQRLAQSGAVPACKVGRAWVFIDDLLFQLLMAKSASRVSVADSQEKSTCRSTDAKTPPCGGSNSRPFAGSRSLYSKALGLPTSGRRSKSTTSSPPPDGSKNGSE
ncbi:helix-turn-helix domain-containing protein [Aquabacterium sp.]|uniref:helix-turn-helix domain-containing protein n=1 Tax=Aquabacterium sp. TaxID=1872578 RepID=UPI0040382827